MNKNCPNGRVGHLVFFTKVLWSRQWSRLWSQWSFSPKAPPDHSDHSPTIGLTIALLLPNKRVTIVTIALFWVLAPGSPAIWPFGHLAILGQNWTFETSTPTLVFVKVPGCWLWCQRWPSLKKTEEEGARRTRRRTQKCSGANGYGKRRKVYISLQNPDGRNGGASVD